MPKNPRNLWQNVNQVIGLSVPRPLPQVDAHALREHIGSIIGSMVEVCKRAHKDCHTKGTNP